MSRIRLSEPAKPSYFWNVCFVVAVILATDSPCFGQGWEISSIDYPPQFSNMTDRSLRLDAQGHPHVVYGEDHLYYASYDGMSWRRETADDEPQTGEYASMVFDASGYPHVSYSSSQGLKHAFKDGNGWHTEVVDNGGWATSIAIGSAGEVNISYRLGEPSYAVKYAVRDETGWHLETIESSSTETTSMVIDDFGYPHIAYVGWGRRTVRHAWRDSGQWHVEDIADSDVYSGRASIATDPAGQQHVVFGSNYTLHYAVCLQGVWQQEVVDTYSWCLSHSSLVVDAAGFPHVIYVYRNGGRSWTLRYAHRAAPGWVIDEIEGTWRDCSIALDSQNRVHATHRTTGNELRYVRKEADEWQGMTVDEPGIAGEYASIALDSQDNAHIAYSAGWPYAYSGLRYAWYDDGVWRIETITSTGEHNRYASIRLSSVNSPSIAFQRDYELKFASRTQAGWIVDTVDNEGSSGSGVSVVFAPDDMPIVSYVTFGASDGYSVKCAHREASGWQIDKVTAGLDLIVSQTSLAIGPEGITGIAYTCLGDGQPSDGLMYAFSEDGIWRFEQLDAAVGYNSEVSLGIDESGTPHIAYHDNWNVGGGLKYAYRDLSVWHIELVDPGPNPGDHLSLSMDSQGRPHIGYSNQNHLCFAWKDEVDWHITVVDEYGSYVALDLDNLDSRHIAYFDQVNGDLRYAFSIGGGLWMPEVSPVLTDLTLHIEGPCPTMFPTPLGLFVAKRGPVNVSVFDLGGRRVRILAASPLPEGTHHLIWDGLDDRGMRVPSGTYICSAEAGGARVSKRIVLIR